MFIKDKPNYNTKLKPITLFPESLVREAIDTMCEKKIGSIIIINHDNTVAGIVTERDMMTRVLANNLDPDTVKLDEIMSKEVKVANENDDLVDWLHTMSHERFRHLPIVDNNNKLVNMMSQGDFVAYTWPDLYEKFRQDLKGRLGRTSQITLLGLAVIVITLLAFNL